MITGKVHGGLSRAGKVKGQTPKIEPTEKRKPKVGRAKTRLTYAYVLSIIKTNRFGEHNGRSGDDEARYGGA